jgi:hypothetical protein
MRRMMVAVAAIGLVLGLALGVFRLGTEMLWDYHEAVEQASISVIEHIDKELDEGKISAAEAKFGVAIMRAEASRHAALKRHYRKHVWWMPMFAGQP